MRGETTLLSLKHDRLAIKVPRRIVFRRVVPNLVALVAGLPEEIVFDVKHMKQRRLSLGNIATSFAILVNVGRQQSVFVFGYPPSPNNQICNSLLACRAVIIECLRRWLTVDFGLPTIPRRT